MRRLWIGDVHANLPALEAVLHDAGDVDDIVLLGDIVGWGHYPSACIDVLMQLQARSVLGNHDGAVLAVGGRSARHCSPGN